MSAITFDAVSKRYRLGAHRTSLRAALGALPRRLLGRGGDDDGADVLWALSDVSFEVERGETLGLIGANGAGKTTALKLLSRVTYPTSGRVSVNGRVAALIELGAGFHPELSGRENVYLNGAILGLSTAEIRRRYEAIVSFAELERFMDTPVKRYSSGMYARLGFAVAAAVAPDVLLVDEVLAVGDASFQRKCFAFMRDYVRGGHATVFVSHNLFALEQLCDRLVWIERGRAVMTGKPHDVLSAYMDDQDRGLRRIVRPNAEHGALAIENVRLSSGTSAESDHFAIGDDLAVHVVWRASEPIEAPHFVLAVWDAAAGQPLFMASMLHDGDAPARLVGRGVVTCRFRSPPLMPRSYHVWGEVWKADRKDLLVPWQPLAGFTVDAPRADTAGGPGSLRHERADAPIRVRYEWSVDSEAGS